MSKARHFELSLHSARHFCTMSLVFDSTSARPVSVVPRPWGCTHHNNTRGNGTQAPLFISRTVANSNGAATFGGAHNTRSRASVHHYIPMCSSQKSSSPG